MDIDELILVKIIYLIKVCFSTLLDIDELILNLLHMAINMRFSTLLDIKKDTRKGVFFVGFLVCVYFLIIAGLKPSNSLMSSTPPLGMLMISLSRVPSKSLYSTWYLPSM